MWGIDLDHYVSGTISPDSVDDYRTVGTYESKGYCQNSAKTFHIWWNGSDAWIISAALGVTGSDYHKRTDPSIVGVYGPEGAATGDATVAEGLTP